MSYTRMGQPGEYADAEHLYAYPSGHGDSHAITIAGRGNIGYDEWAEVTGRILERHTDDEELIEKVVELILVERDKWIELAEERQKEPSPE